MTAACIVATAYASRHGAARTSWTSRCTVAPRSSSSIERDYEDIIHVALLVDDDPGKDLGALRQPGHRFFFGLDDIERVDTEEERP